MGRTLPSITQAFLNEQQSLSRFRRALRREDQRALDDLLADARQHLAASAYASHLLPFEVMLLAMLVEEHKRVLHLETQLELLRREVGLATGAGLGESNRLPSADLSPDSDGPAGRNGPSDSEEPAVAAGLEPPEA